MVSKSIISLLLIVIHSVSYGNEVISEHYESRRVFKGKLVRNTLLKAEICCMGAVSESKSEADVIDININVDGGESLRVYKKSAKDFVDYTCKKKECKPYYMFQIKVKDNSVEDVFARFYCGGERGDSDLTATKGPYFPIVVAPGTSLEVKGIEKTDGRSQPDCSSNIAHDDGEESTSSSNKKGKRTKKADAPREDIN